MKSAYQVGQTFARQTIQRGELGEVVMIDLERIFSEDFVRGFWQTVEAIGNAMKKSENKKG